MNGLMVRLFGLWRGGERKADVVVLSGGKCVVAWPTSVVVYDSEEVARKVHVEHMGGRGDVTEFRSEAVASVDGDGPVLPLSKFCEAMRTWFRCIRELNATAKEQDKRVEALAKDLHRTTAGRPKAWDQLLEESQAEYLARARLLDELGWRSSFGGTTHGYAYAHVLDRVDIDISKSNLLWRLLYGGEPLRTRPCPEHKGHWSGIDPCRHGCGSTGWVHEGWPENANPCNVCGQPAVARLISVSGIQTLCYDHYVECWDGAAK